MLLFAVSAQALCAQLRFERFSLNERLPSNSVIRTYNDSEGYMWFGTKDGLCRFDGYDIKIFRSSAFTPGRLTNNEIQSIAEDNERKIWIGTIEGVNILDKKSFSVSVLNNDLIRKERINSITKDFEGNIWIGTSSSGVVRMSATEMKELPFDAPLNKQPYPFGKSINNIFQDKAGRLWFSSWKNG